MKAKLIFTLSVLLLIAFCSSAFAASQKIITSSTSNVDRNLSLIKEVKHSLEIAYGFLLKTQEQNGSWKYDPAITSLALYSFLINPTFNPDDRTDLALKKGFEFLESHVKPDGGIYRKEYQNYVTAVSLMAFAESRLPKYKTIITNAKNFLIRFQADESEGYAESHHYYGGIGYGGDARPDLSNTQFALDAIKAAEDYEARYKNIIPAKAEELEKEEAELGLHWKKALIFLARTQNVLAVNKMAYATDDGGFIYEPGTYKKERSHSYGSMTYAGLKSLLHARVGKDDIRVQKAVDWITKNYTLDVNPGFGTTSIYYYYMTFGKTLNVLGEEVLIDSQGQKHFWREDLAKKLLSLQHEDGYWVNQDGRYWENIKTLATAYSIIGMKMAVYKLIEEK